MRSSSRQTYKGTIAKKLPQGLYLVQCEDGRHVRASLDREAKAAVISLVPGEHVVVRLSSLDPSRGQIESRC